MISRIFAFWNSLPIPKNFNPKIPKNLFDSALVLNAICNLQFIIVKLLQSNLVATFALEFSNFSIQSNANVLFSGRFSSIFGLFGWNALAFNDFSISFWKKGFQCKFEWKFWCKDSDAHNGWIWAWPWKISAS